MNSKPIGQPTSRASTGALSQQPTLVPSLSQQSTLNDEIDPADRAAFAKALDAFRLRLTTEERKSFNNASWETVWKEMIQLQRVQEQRKEMVNLRRIQGFLEGMQHLGKTIEVFLNANDAVAFVWGPIKFLLLTAANVADTFDTLLDAYEQIGEALPFLEGVEKLFGDSPHLISALIWIYIDILTFHKRALRFFHGPKWYRGFKALWKDFDTEFGGILKSLHRHKDLVSNRATLSYYEKYKEETEQIQTKLDEIVAGERDKRRTAVVEWLAVDQRAYEDHNDLRNIRAQYSTTGKWILDREFVKHWLDATIPATPLLWIHGIPGAGKTILASAIIDECKKKQEFSTCFVYCHDGDQNSNSALTIIKGIVGQLLEQHELNILPLIYARKRLSGEPVLRSLQLAKKMFEDCCLAMGKMFFIVDGLDECDLVERKQIIEVLMDLVAECDADEEGKLRILIVSQELGDIKRALQSNAAGRLTPRILPICDNDTRKDISAFVRTWVDKIAIKFAPFTDDMKRYLRGLTIENAKGMFLYAKLVMEDLHDQPTLGDFLNSIRSETFPKKLEEAYDRIMRRIKRTSSDAEWAMAKRLLGWMVCAKRQLTWKEMQVAVSIDHMNQEIEYDTRRLRTHIHDTCGSLVVVTGERITLVHSTAKSFITTTPDGIHEPSVESELAILCLQYLTFPCFDKEGIGENQLQEMMLEGHFAFQDYAVAKWFYHVNAMVKSGKRLLEEAPDRDSHMENMASATDDFITKYDEIDWSAGIRKECRINCSAFEGYPAHENLVLITSHIYTFQQKGFDLRHKISIKTLEETIERNRKLLEEFPSAKTTKKDQLEKYKQFYNAKKPFKCNKITCRYFSEGFADKKSRKKHVNVHDRPFYCEVENCLGAEGFANNKDLDKHNRAFHPEMTELGKTFNSGATRKAKADYVCTICGKTFTRNFHRKNHELSHRGVRPHACAECGKAFTRMNDMMRHVRTIHERGRA